MRRDVFFYGTLLDDDVRALVLGVAPKSARLIPATLTGHRRAALKGRAYPALFAADDDAVVVEGVVLTHCTRGEWAHLVAYEGPEYGVGRVTVVTESGPRAADVFQAGPAHRPLDTGRDWSFDAWERRHKRAYLERLGAEI